MAVSVNKVCASELGVVDSHGAKKIDTKLLEQMCGQNIMQCEIGFHQILRLDCGKKIGKVNFDVIKEKITDFNPIEGYVMTVNGSNTIILSEAVK